MPPFLPKPPIPRPQTLFIYSQFTLHKSLKNFLKHPKTLCIKSQSQQSNLLPTPLFKRLQRRLKSLRALDIGKHQEFLDLPVPQALTLIKSFNTIHSLTLFGDLQKHFSDKSYCKFLSQSRNLTHLTFDRAPGSDPSRPITSSLLKLIQANYEKTLKNTKISSFVLKSLESAEHFCSESDSPYPSSLKELSITPDSFLFKFRFNLSNLQNLSILRLNFFVPFNDFLNILLSLPSSDQLTHLTVYVAQVPDYYPKYASKITESLKYFGSLRSIDLGTESFLYVSALLKSLSNPLNLYQLSLRTLLLDGKQLKELALAIENLSNLTLLSIKNIKSIQQGEASEGHQVLFSKISGLAKLKSLEISLHCRGQTWIRGEIWNGCLGEFSGCLMRLPELSEISFTQSEIGHKEEMDLFFDALREKGSSLKKLKLQLMSGSDQVDHLERLNRALGSWKNLEELCLQELQTSKESLIQFGETVSELKWLRSVKLDGEGADLEKADLLRTVKMILMKYGLEILEWFGRYPIPEVENNQKVDCIDIKEVLLRNPRLFSIKLNLFGLSGRKLVFKNVKGFLL